MLARFGNTCSSRELASSKESLWGTLPSVATDPPQMCRKMGISWQTYYRWRKRYGGMQVNQATRLKELEQENARLKKLLAESLLDQEILKEAASGNY